MTKERDRLAGAQFTDLKVASMVRMLCRDDFDHEMVCVMARDRIVWLRESLDAAEAQIAARDAAPRELLAVLREAWRVPEVDAMTLFLSAFMGGVHEEWLKQLPQNGFVCAAQFPDIGKVEISIRRIDGKSAAESLKELTADNERLKQALDESAVRMNRKIDEWHKERDGLSAVDAETRMAIRKKAALDCVDIAVSGQDTTAVDGDRIFRNGWRISAQVIEDQIREHFGLEGK